MIDTEKYQPARQNMKLVTRSLRSLATLYVFSSCIKSTRNLPWATIDHISDVLKLHVRQRQANCIKTNKFIWFNFCTGTNVQLCFGEAYFEYLESCDFFPWKYNIDVSVFMFDLRMINMSSECEYDWYWKISRFCLPMPFRFRKHKGHDLAYDVKIMTSQQRLSRIVTSTFLLNDVCW
jgi:hypothetical protein